MKISSQIIHLCHFIMILSNHYKILKGFKFCGKICPCRKFLHKMLLDVSFCQQIFKTFRCTICDKPRNNSAKNTIRRERERERERERRRGTTYHRQMRMRLYKTQKLPVILEYKYPSNYFQNQLSLILANTVSLCCEVVT